MADAGWRLTDRGWTNEPEMDSALKDRLTASRDAAKPFPPKGGTDVPDGPGNAVAVPAQPAEQASGGHGFRFGFWKHKHSQD